MPVTYLQHGNRFLPFLFILLFAGCAGQLSPGGGPVDTTPPIVVTTSPPNNATGVSTQSVSVEFNKYVDRRSFEESIFISPPVGTLEFDWGGREVTVSWSDSLRKNTTYVVTLGTDIIDTRNRNRLAEAYSFAFSTGERIDRASIGGRVYDERRAGVMILAYDLMHRPFGTCDPCRESPDFVSQTGNDGRYTLTHLPPGMFRVFALRDEDRNLRYDRGLDAIGVPRGDVRIDTGAQRVMHLNFMLTKEDNVQPRLLLASAIDRRHVELRLSKGIDTARFDRAHVTITDSLGKSLPVQALFLSPQQFSSITAVTAAQTSGMQYRATVDSVWDVSGLGIALEIRTAPFTGSAVPDTLPPRLFSSTIADSARDVQPGAPIGLSFSDAVVSKNFADSLRFTDSTGAAVRYHLRWLDAASVSLRLPDPLSLDARYGLSAPADAVMTLAGLKAVRPVRLTFWTARTSTLGSLSGVVIDTTAGRQGGNVVMTATRVEPPASFTVVLPDTGTFQFGNVPEGRYTLRGYRSTTGKYDFGSVLPFRPAAPFAVFPDTIRVRARWLVEGITFRFE